MTQRTQTKSGHELNRRNLLLGAGAGALALTGGMSRAHAADTLVVADPGGEWGKACAEAFIKPFEKETGVKITQVARAGFPSVEIKAMVETKTYVWDVVITGDTDAYELEPLNLIEPLDWTGEDMSQLGPESRTAGFMATDFGAMVLAYRTDKFGQNGPKSWADFWDVAKFPGRRAFRKHPIEMLEIALIADGVPLKSLYPLDIPRALKKLDKLKPHVAVWWTSAAQTTQLLVNGEVDLLPAYNGRAQVAINAGKPVKIDFNEGIFSGEGWVIPKGNPKADLARKFVKFTANAKRQGDFVNIIPFAPSNQKAYAYIPQTTAAYLPTAPNNLSLMVQRDAQWWGKNKEEAIRAFDAWILT